MTIIIASGNGFVCFQDVPLFEGIISDLFPGVQSPQPDFGVFLEALKDNIAKHKLQPVPWFIDKIIQVILLIKSNLLLFLLGLLQELHFLSL